MITPPSAQASIQDLADFMELESWRRGTTSLRELLAAIGRLDDNEYDDGIEDCDERNASGFEEVLTEIERRRSACNGGYPFELTVDGTVLRDNAIGSTQQLLYRYLLLGTQLNMNTNKVQAKIDGTQLLEKISAEALKSYLGEGRAQSLVFGTAVPGGFKEKVNHLCHQLKEGGGFRHIDPVEPTAKDGKLDSVAWLPFADGYPGKVILFCQCKTGSSWQNQVTQLRPDDFGAKYTDRGFPVAPVRVFCISEVIDQLHWKSTTIDAGILLDRCRLVELCSKLPSDLQTDVFNWTEAAMIQGGVPSGRLMSSAA